VHIFFTSAAQVAGVPFWPPPLFVPGGVTIGSGQSILQENRQYEQHEQQHEQQHEPQQQEQERTQQQQRQHQLVFSGVPFQN